MLPRDALREMSRVFIFTCAGAVSARQQKGKREGWGGAGRRGGGGRKKKKRGEEKRGELNDVSHARSFGRAGDASVWARTGSELGFF
jgi:hypothetical protein